MAISKITGSALDKNVIMKDVASADGSSPTLTLQSGDTDIAVNDVLGTINFQAPDEGAGTDAILVAAGIAAVSEGDFSSSNNATKLSFLTGASEAASEKMSLSSGGNLTVTGDVNVGANFDITGNSVTDGTSLVTGVLTTTAATVSNGGGQFNGAINVGVDDTGYDVKFFGATASAYMQWDASTDDLILGGAAKMGIKTTTPLHSLDIDASATGAIPTNAGMGTSTDNDNYFGFHNVSNSATFSGLSFETRTSGASRWLIANEWKETYKGDLVFRTRDGGSSSSESIRLLNAGGITFNGDTAAANALDDYEEGVHQTAITMGTSGTATLNTSFDRFSYTKIGRIVTITGNPRIASVSSPDGAMSMTLPFTANAQSTDEARGGGIFGYYDNSAGSGSYTKPMGFHVQENTAVLSINNTNTNGANVTPAASDEFLFSFSYITP